jgi:alanine racemase
MRLPLASHNKKVNAQNFSQNYANALRAYPAQVIVDLEALRNNMAHIVEVANASTNAIAGSTSSADSTGSTGSAAVQVMGMVKADAYGHGLVPCALAALAGGATWLGTAQAYEALSLRKAGIGPDRAKILALLGNPFTADFAEMIENDIDISVGSLDTLHAIAASAEKIGRPARIHVEVDTGFSRGGFTQEDFPAAIDALHATQAAHSIEIIGLWSHLSSADTPSDASAVDATDRQIASFENFSALMNAAGIPPQIRHLANTAALFDRPEIRYDLVRPGIGLYGYEPDVSMGTPADFGLIPAMTLQAQIITLKRIPAGSTISYGRAYAVPRSDSRSSDSNSSEHLMAIVPLGYADGIPRSASGTNLEGALHIEKLGAPVAFHTSDITSDTASGPAPNGVKIFHIAGRVCMDQFIVDLGRVDEAENLGIHDGDTVTLFGTGRGTQCRGAQFGEPTADDWAEACGTINYEIFTALRHRVPRLYRNAEKVLSTADIALLDQNALIS